MKRFVTIPCTLAFAIALVACGHGNQNPPVNATPASTPQQAKAAATARSNDRDQLDQIPPPSKTRYLAIHTKESWGNPFLIVGKKNLTLRIMYPEGPKSDVLSGSMMHPADARKRELVIRLSDLPEALAALPEDAWPYGRVVAVDEDSMALRADRVPVRRNVEATINALNDLGVVVYEWPGSGLIH
ncbi:hypothetical protein [Silvibacterium acidisoli]|uniref:hypothetical protein n=1 Tax=Acidobacteriaceae bacterium ZG23-2 TaxID=2883246 RepID=UPI00406D2554